MLIISLLIMAILAGAAAAGVMWRRLDALSREVAALRAALDAMGAQARSRAPAPLSAQPQVQPQSQQIFAFEAEPRKLWPDAPQPLPDDPFDDSWAINRSAPAQETTPWRTPPRARRAETPAPTIAHTPPPAALGPVSASPPWHAPSHKLWRAVPYRLIIIAALLLAPGLALLFRAPALWTGAAALLVIAGAYAVSLRPGWRRAAWIAAVGCGGWGFWGAENIVAGWCALGLTLAAGAALTRALLRQELGPALLAMAALAGPLFELAAHGGGPTLAALAAVIAAMAIVGATSSQLEILHVSAWVAACAALLIVSGSHEAAIWFAPACGWAGALFLGIALVRAPTLGRRGAAIAATGASAPILALMSLHVAGRELASPALAAAGLSVAGLLIAGVLVLAARRAGGLAQLGIAIIPLGVGACGALTLAFLLALPAPAAAAALMALALGLLGLDARWPHRLWRLLAACLAIGDIGLAAANFDLAQSSLEAGPAALAIALGLAAPAALAFAAAHVSGARAPITACICEAAAIVASAAAASAAIRWGTHAGVGAGATPLFFEAGIHAAAWGGLALAAAAFDKRGAWIVRRAAVWLLGAAALALVAAGPLSLLNPLWGAWRVRIAGWALANTLALGFLAPAAFAWAHWALWRIRGAPRRAAVSLGAAVLLSFTWAMLETRRAFQGEDLTMGPARAPELAAYVVVTGLAVAAAVLVRAALANHLIVSSSTSVGGETRQEKSLAPIARK
ncbi:MAG: DUF2339 domain-containing protein [Hyphomonadaceae bacterium]